MGLVKPLTQHYDCVVIPPFDPATGNLPAGVHDATWDEFVARYGHTSHRLRLLAGLKTANGKYDLIQPSEFVTEGMVKSGKLEELHLAALPNLTNPAFSNAKVNGANANLQTSEQMQLIDSNGKVIGAPSAPNATRDGFSACTWASSC